MRTLLTLAALLALAGCARHDVLSATADSIAIKSNSNPGPTAAEHCAKYGRKPQLTATAPTGVWTEQVYNFACVR
jgi:hypothetical protein